jgi:regulator of replication initiation timing
MSKIISVEKTKILKHVEEINSLKVDNMKLIGQLQEQQSAVTKMSEQIKTLEEIEPIDDLKVKLQNVTEERDYLHTML